MTVSTPTKEPRTRATTRTRTAQRAVQGAATQVQAASEEPRAAAPMGHDAAAAPEPQAATAAEDPAVNSGPSLGSNAAPALAPAPARLTKGARLLEMLAAPEGATLASLGQALGWQAHTLRAALTRLRQAGHTVERSKSSEGETVYRIGPSQPDGAAGAQQVEQTEVTPGATATAEPEAEAHPVNDAETASPAPLAPEALDGGAA